MKHGSNQKNNIKDTILLYIKRLDKSEVLGIILIVLAFILFKTARLWCDIGIPKDVQRTNIMSAYGMTYMVFMTGAIVFALGHIRRLYHE